MTKMAEKEHRETRYGYLNGSAATCIVIIIAELIDIDIQKMIKRRKYIYRREANAISNLTPPRKPLRASPIQRDLLLLIVDNNHHPHTDLPITSV